MTAACPTPSPAGPPGAATATAAGAAATAAAAAAAVPGGWDAVARVVRGCTACPELVATREQVVVGERAAAGRPRLVLVGEAPGADEDASGRPFVGRAGRLLVELLEEAGLTRDDVALLNTLRCRPPANRRPRAAETRACAPWLDAQLDLVEPGGDPLVVALGTSAAAWFVGSGRRGGPAGVAGDGRRGGQKPSLASLRGSVHRLRGRRVLVTYHPSAALRFGPRGEPRRALAEDLVRAAALTAG